MGWILTLLAAPLHRLADLFDWMIDRPVRVLIFALALLAATGWLRAHMIDADRDAWRAAAQAERSAHLETKARVAAAAQGATDLAESNRVAVEARWQAQYQEAVHANDILRDRNRALLAQWLRDQRAGRTDPGIAGDADLPGAATLPAGAVHDAETAVVPVSDLADTAAAFAQLEALIGLVTSAATVPTSPAPPAPGVDAR